MDNNLDNLKKFFESIKTIGLFDRIFGWKKIRNQLVDASADLQKLFSNVEISKDTILKLESRNNGLDKDLQLKNQRKSELDIEVAGLKRDLQNSQAESADVKRQNTYLIKDEEFRKQEHSNSLAALSKIQDQIQQDRSREVE
jgi:hypothetical protein